MGAARLVHRWLAPVAGIYAAALALAAARAYACAACACGDPTLTVMGAEQPFSGRLRIALDIQYRSDAIGHPLVDRITLEELRTSLSVAYAPTRWSIFSLTAPFIGRELTDVTLARERLITIGDVELHGRAYIFRDREFAPRHMLAVQLGLRLPTGPVLRDASGNYRPPEVQPGSGSFDPSAGLTYLLSADPWSMFVSEIVYVPTRGVTDYKVGVSWRGTHALQYQILSALALRAGVNHRFEARSKLGSVNEPDSGGFILFAALAAVWNPVEDLVLTAEAQVPVANALYGVHDEGMFLTVGAAYDF